MICAVLEAAKVADCYKSSTEREAGKEVVMKKIFNGTPHSIDIIVNGVSDPAIRKLVVPEGTEPVVVVTIPSSGMLSAKIETIDGEVINGIPTFEKKVSGCDLLPESYDIFIVSALYASCARAVGMDTSKMYTVADPVYTADGRTILGCKGICPAY